MKPLFSALIACAIVVSAATNYEDEGRRWWSHIEALANDRMESRNTGSEGHHKAAAYVAATPSLCP
jgi:hypothetical protein